GVCVFFFFFFLTRYKKTGCRCWCKGRPPRPRERRSWEWVFVVGSTRVSRAQGAGGVCVRRILDAREIPGHVTSFTCRAYLEVSCRECASALG
ncbi:hypothetical protein BDP55DRAFT_719983, partial [Colletotrichum godetiae]